MNKSLSHDPFHTLIGNEQVKLFLNQMIGSGQVANSLLFAGPSGIGKSLFAKALAQVLLGQEISSDIAALAAWHHADLHVYRPEGKIGMHSIDTLRQFHDDVYLAPFEAKRKIFILHEAERMLPYSANALLKTFEEPPLDTVIILLSSAPEHLLTTVLSRCRKVYFRPLPTPLITRQSDDPHTTQILQVLAKGKFKTYAELKQFAQETAATIEKRKEDLDGVMREELLRGSRDTMTAVQKEGIEKEIDGAVAMRSRQEVDHIFDLILSWYRDLHVVRFNVPISLMTDRRYAEDLDQVVQRGELQGLEEVQKTISESRLAIDRFMPLNSCLEGLFLKLNFL